MLWAYFVLLLSCAYFVDGGTYDKKCPPLNLPGGEVRYRRNIAKFTCNEGLTLLGDDLIVCSDGEWSGPPPKCIGTNCTKPTVGPHISMLTFLDGGMLQFFCDVGLVRVGHETIVCNGTNWSEEPPKCEVGVSEGCDFEDGLCGWNNDWTGNVTWSRHSGKTPTEGTGPADDHTKSDHSGHYLFVESTGSSSANRFGRFISPLYTDHVLDSMCLQFYYHMFGDAGINGVGSLEIFLKPKDVLLDSLNFSHRIFYDSGNKGDVWIQAVAALANQTEPFQIVFQVRLTKSFLSDIAIDDILISSNCSLAPPGDVTKHATTSTTETTTQLLNEFAATSVATYDTSYTPEDSPEIDTSHTASSKTAEPKLLTLTTVADSDTRTVDISSTPGNNEEDGAASDKAKVGHVEGSKEASETDLFLPLVIGVVSAVCVGVVIFGLLKWSWAKNEQNKGKRDNFTYTNRVKATCNVDVVCQV